MKFMKFRLLGMQEVLLNDTDHFNPSILKTDGYSVIDGPVGGVLDWPAKDLLRLAKYADSRADSISSGGDLDPSHHAEIRSLRGLAKRIRKTVAKAEEK